MKFRVQMTYEYEVPDEELLDVYETGDPARAAEIDRQDLLGDPSVIHLMTDFKPPTVITVTPVGG